MLVVDLHTLAAIDVLNLTRQVLVYRFLARDPRGTAGIDGIEATRRLKAAFGGTAVIGISVNASREVEVAMRRAGVDHFLSKEAPIEQIYRTILAATRKLRMTATA